MSTIKQTLAAIALAIAVISPAAAQTYQQIPDGTKRPPLSENDALAISFDVIKACQLPFTKPVAARVVAQVYEIQKATSFALGGATNAADQIRIDFGKLGANMTCEIYGFGR